MTADMSDCYENSDRATTTPSFLRRNVTPYSDTGQESTLPYYSGGSPIFIPGGEGDTLMKYSEERSDEESTISPPAG